jgi:hypothetical protein
VDPPSIKRHIYTNDVSFPCVECLRNWKKCILFLLSLCLFYICSDTLSLKSLCYVLCRNTEAQSHVCFHTTSNFQRWLILKIALSRPSRLSIQTKRI